MSAHTPGPWMVGVSSKYGTNNANIIFSNGGESSVATVYGLPMNTKLEEVDSHYAEGLANARLIAAAPDMLEALCALVLNIDAGGPTLDAMRDARAAIVKATGEAA